MDNYFTTSYKFMQRYNAAYFVDELLPTGRLEKKAERLYQIKK